MNGYAVFGAYFSPSGTTESGIKHLSSILSTDPQFLNLLHQDSIKTQFHSDDVLIVGVPVFSGRVPTPCIDILTSMQGTNTPAIAVAVYGNRDYDDALLELKTILEKQGFCVFAAAAVVAQHSIFPSVAAGRPDKQDFEMLTRFAVRCKENLATLNPVDDISICVKGNTSYRKIVSVPIKPSANATCNACGLCARLCPVHAIEIAHPKKTKKDVCISCTACIAACPQHARNFPKPAHTLAAKVFEKKFSARKEPEFFI
jgi:ferredoxin/flavodoxin